MHYLYANRHAGIGYTSDGNREPIAWYDSGHMQDRVDYKSQYGYVIMWFGGPLCWISKKHNHVGESSAEDEYMALNHCYKKAKWLISLFDASCGISAAFFSALLSLFQAFSASTAAALSATGKL